MTRIFLLRRRKGPIAGNFRQLGRRAQESRDFESERLLEMTLDLFAQRLLLGRARLEDHIAAGDKGLDGRKTKPGKFVPQAFHADGPPAHIDRPEKSEIARHAFVSA